MKIKKIFSKFILGITLLCSVQTYPMADPDRTPTAAEYKEMVDAQIEMFEELLTEVREQTSNIGYCMQQLQQAIQMGKVSCTVTQKTQTLHELKEVQFLTQDLLDKLLVQADPTIIMQGLVFNHAMITYLLPTIKKDVLAVKAQDLDAVIQTVCQKQLENMNQELFNDLLVSNKQDIAQLTDATDYVGLKWYNNWYRTCKKWHAGTVIKYGSIGVATLFLTGLFASYANGSLPSCIQNANWFQNCIANPNANWGKDGMVKIQEAVLDETGNILKDKGRIIYDTIPATPKDLPFFQNIQYTLDKFQAAGIIAMGALAKLDFHSMFSYLYGEDTAKAKAKAKKAAKHVDTFFMGTQKKNKDKDGVDKASFKDMTGAEHLEELAKNIANFMKHPERYERAQIEEHKGILLYGPPQTGKTMFAAALRNMITEEMDGKKIHFWDAKAMLDQDSRLTIEAIFYIAQMHSPSIIFFDEIDLVGAHRDKSSWNTGQILTGMRGIDPTKQVIVIGATNRPDQLDSALLQDGRFGKIIYVDRPKYNERKTFLTKEVALRNIDVSPNFIDYIAQETEGCSYNNLRRIVTEAYARSMRELRTVTEQDFDNALDTEIRQIQPAPHMSEQAKEITAIYQAGKAVARHILKTKKSVVKVTINPVAKKIKAMERGAVDIGENADNKKLVDAKAEQKLKNGEVFTKALTTDYDILSDKDQINEALALLAGKAAHKLLLNTSYTSCNPQDRAEAMEIIYSLISNGEKIDDAMKEKAVELKKKYEHKMHSVLEENKELLQKVVDMLMKQGSINRYEWEELIK